MVHSVTHYYMITSITTITTDFHYYINTHYYHYYHYSPPNFEMRCLVFVV